MDAQTFRPRSGGVEPRSPIGEREDRIEGSFRRISIHQLTMAWWLYHSGHMTRRQYRVYFAAHELDERRRYTSPEHRGAKPRYTMNEIARLVGGAGDERAIRELRSDLRALHRLGLVTVSKHRITFAISADQLRVDDLAGFWSMFSEMPNRRRTVPVPRRLLRALAAGFSKGVTATITAVLIRGLFWHRETSDYRTDGRYKLSWVAEHFGISRRAATEARAKLIELGWIEPLDVSQWEMNRWGLRDRIVTDWSQATETTEAVGGSDRAGESATPHPGFDAESATPDLTDSLSLTGDKKTRRLPERERSGVSPGSTLGSRKKDRRSERSTAQAPNIRDMKAGDLGSVTRLLELHRQASRLGLVSASEAGRLDFIALAQRARSRGKRAGALFYWLLREHKTGFITHADEEEAARMLREHLNGPREKPQICGEGQSARTNVVFSEDAKRYAGCIAAARQKNISDPYIVAQRVFDWDREQWGRAQFEHEQAKSAQWSGSIIQQSSPQDPGAARATIPRGVFGME